MNTSPYLVGASILAASLLAAQPAPSVATPAATAADSASGASATGHETALGRLEAAETFLRNAASALHAATTNNKGGNVEKAVANVELARARVTEAIAYVKAHPEANTLAPVPAVSRIVPADLLAHETKLANGTWKNPKMADAVLALNDALGEFIKKDSTGYMVVLGDTGGLRDKILDAINQANSDVIAGIDVANHGTSATSFSTFPASGPRSSRAPAAPQWTSDADMNFYFVDRFIEADGMGFSTIGPAARVTVADAMRLNITDITSLDSSKPAIARSLKIDSFELIGIAKHNSPVAFATPLHGRSYSEPTRALTDFETKALAQLRTGVDVSVYTDQGTRLAVGAIRAQQSCLSCHSGYKVGDLLGAFTYRLSLVNLSASVPAPMALPNKLP